MRSSPRPTTGGMRDGKNHHLGGKRHTMKEALESPCCTAVLKSEPVSSRTGSPVYSNDDRCQRSSFSLVVCDQITELRLT